MLQKGSGKQMPRKMHSDQLLAIESRYSKVSDGVGSEELRTCRSNLIRLPAGGSPCSCGTNTDDLNDKMQPSSTASNSTHDVATQYAIDQSQQIRKCRVVRPCGCSWHREDPNGRQQSDNVSSNSSQNIARQEVNIPTQPILKKCTKCPCSCISRRAVWTPTNHPMPKDSELLEDQNSQSRLHTHSQSTQSGSGASSVKKLLEDQNSQSKSHTDSQSGMESTQSGSGTSSLEDKDEIELIEDQNSQSMAHTWRREDPNGRQQPDNVSSNSSQTINRQEDIIQTQSIPKMCTKCPCSSISRRAVVSPTNHPNDSKVLEDENSQSMSHTHSQSGMESTRSGSASSSFKDRDEINIPTQPIPKMCAKCPCSCISRRPVLTPTNNSMPKDMELLEKSKSHTDSQSCIESTQSGSGSSSFEDRAESYQRNNSSQDTSQHSSASAKVSATQTKSPSFEDELERQPEACKSSGDSPKDSFTQTSIPTPKHSFTQTNEVTPRESPILTAQTREKETNIENEHPKVQKKSVNRFWKRPQIVVPSPQKSVKQEDTNQTRVSLEKVNKETQYEDCTSLLQQENNDQSSSLQISKDYNDQIASPKENHHKETQVEDSDTSESSQNIEKCANCSHVPELLQKMFDMEEKMNQQETSLKQLCEQMCDEKNKSARPSSSSQDSKNQAFHNSVKAFQDGNSKGSPRGANNNSTENLKEQACKKFIEMFMKPEDQESNCACEDLGSCRDISTSTSTLEKNNRQKSSTKVIPTESQLNSNEEVNETLIEKFVHMFRKCQCEETIEPTTHSEECSCPLPKISKRNSDKSPTKSTTPQVENQVETRSSSTFTQSDDEVTEMDTKYKSQRGKLILEESQSTDSMQTLEQHSLQSHESSLCQFCRDKELPVLDHMIDEVTDLIGLRRPSRIVMTVLLRADNLYHVNIRELDTGCVLGCLLANDAAIEEAISLGLFERILTFCVTDVRSTIKPRDGPFAIHFELLEQRGSGGGWEEETASLPEKVLEFATQVLGLNLEYVRRLFSLTNAIKLDKQTSVCSLRGRSQSMGAHTELILIDNEENYSMRSHSDSECTREGLGASSSLFLRIVTGRANREENS